MFRNSIVLILTIHLLSPARVGAQSSSLRGTVTDSQNALMPGVVITATNVDTSLMRSTISDEVGAYAFPQLAPGSYKVKGELAGFTTFRPQTSLQIDSPA